MLLDHSPARVRILTTCPHLDNEVSSWATWEPVLNCRGLHTQQATRPVQGGAVAGELQDSGELIEMRVCFLGPLEQSPMTGGLNSRNLLSYSSRSWKSSRGQRGGHLLEALHLASFWGLQQPWALRVSGVARCPSSVPVCPGPSRGVLLPACSVCLSSLLLKTLLIG